jgi:hypothetical protein
VQLQARFSERSQLLAELLAAWAPQATARVDGAMGAAAETLLQELVRNSPVGHGPSPGTLRRSWRLERDAGRFVLSNPTPHLFYVRHGNDYPHSGGGSGWIYPKNAQALSFTIGGQHFFRRRVRASQPNDFIGRSVTAWRPEANKLVQTAVHSSVRWIVSGA